MKTGKLLAALVLAATFAACSDEDSTPYTLPTDGTVGFTGTLTTTAAGAFYASDATTAQLVWTADGKARLVIAQMTARPATDTTPASIMTDFTVEDVSVEAQGGGVFTLSTEAFQGGGTMGGRHSAFRQGNVSGIIEGKRLTVTVDYKFTESPYEPQLSSTFVGTAE